MGYKTIVNPFNGQLQRVSSAGGGGSAVGSLTKTQTLTNGVNPVTHNAGVLCKAVEVHLSTGESIKLPWDNQGLSTSQIEITNGGGTLTDCVIDMFF